MYDPPPMDLGFIFQLALGAVGLLSVWFTIRNDIANTKRELTVQAEALKLLAESMAKISPILAAHDGRIKAVEDHGEKVDKIEPLVQRVTSFESHVMQSIEGFREQLRDMAFSLRELTTATLSRPRAS